MVKIRIQEADHVRMLGDFSESVHLLAQVISVCAGGLGEENLHGHFETGALGYPAPHLAKRTSA